MWPFTRKKTSKKDTQQQHIFFIQGMHCTSCSLNIDNELEDLPGVTASSTSYAKAQTTVTFDPSVIPLQRIQKTIEKLGYTVSKAQM